MTYRTVLLGDSHMEALANLLRPLLAAKSLEVVHVEANRGKSTAWYVSEDRLEAIVRQYHPDIVVVELGTNDQPNESYAATLNEAVSQLQSVGLPEIFWFGPSYTTTSLASRFDAVRTQQATVLPGLGVHWFDSWPMTRQGQGPDGVHFTSAGYQTWATGMSSKIEVASGVSSALPFVAIALAAVCGIFLARLFR